MTISRNVFEGRCHQVPRLATKSIRDPPRRKGQITKGSLPKPPEPLQMKSVWGKMFLKRYISEKMRIDLGFRLVVSICYSVIPITSYCRNICFYNFSPLQNCTNGHPRCLKEQRAGSNKKCEEKQQVSHEMDDGIASVGHLGAFIRKYSPQQRY